MTTPPVPGQFPDAVTLLIAEIRELNEAVTMLRAVMMPRTEFEQHARDLLDVITANSEHLAEAVHKRAAQVEGEAKLRRGRFIKLVIAEMVILSAIFGAIGWQVAKTNHTADSLAETSRYVCQVRNNNEANTVIDGKALVQLTGELAAVDQKLVAQGVIDPSIAKGRADAYARFLSRSRAGGPPEKVNCDQYLEK